MRTIVLACGVGLLVTLAGRPTPAAGPAPESSAVPVQPETLTLTGKVVKLAEVLKPLGGTFDTEPIAQQVVVRAADGTITPLLSDEGSRALFRDDRLRNRPVEIQGRKFPGLPYVQVVSFRVEDHGKLRVPEYYCEICTISARWPQTCACCQGPMVLRMRPESR